MTDSGSKKAAAPTTVDEYLALLPESERSALEHLRQTIKSEVPDAAEVISYGVPVFKYKGKPLVSMGAAKNHLSFYLMSTHVADAHKDELKPFHASGGTVRFTPDAPLPQALVKKLVQARIEENEEPLTKKKSGY